MVHLRLNQIASPCTTNPPFLQFCWRKGIVAGQKIILIIVVQNLIIHQKQTMRQRSIYCYTKPGTVKMI